ncbi:MAG: hypothetical protein U0R19_37890 [Bryobacteraceae bacterium]
MTTLERLQQTLVALSLTAVEQKVKHLEQGIKRPGYGTFCWTC